MEQAINTMNKGFRSFLESKSFAALSEIAKTATQKDGLSELFSKIVDFISEVMEVEIVSIMLPDDSDPDYLIIKSARGLPNEILQSTRVRIGSQISGYVYATGEPLLIEDIDYEVTKRFGIANRERYKTPSLLSIPIKGSTGILGVINVNNKKSGLPFCEDDFNLLSILSGYIGLSIENTKHCITLLEKEKDFKQLTDRLQTMLEHQSHILMKLSYAIRSPLTGILGYTELLLNRTDSGLSESDKAILKKIIDKSWKLAQLADRIFEYESALCDEIKFEPKKVNLKQLIEGVTDRVSVHAPDKNVDVKLIAQDTPEVLVDPFYFSKAISELVDNAIRYTKSGGTVEIRLKTEGSKAKVWVKDQGHGIMPEQVEKIFYPFFKASADDCEDVERLGLGLSLAKLIIDKHSGTIKVDKTGADGSTFLVEIPCWQNKTQIQREH